MIKTHRDDEKHRYNVRIRDRESESRASKVLKIQSDAGLEEVLDVVRIAVDRHGNDILEEVRDQDGVEDGE